MPTGVDSEIMTPPLPLGVLNEAAFRSSSTFSSKIFKSTVSPTSEMS
jgi:hypothetical protein